MPSTSNRRSKRQEEQGSRRFGGRVTPGSGNQWVRKNDVRTDTESIEFKITGAKSYSVKIYDLLKAWVIATIDSRKVIFGIEFIPEAMTHQGPLRWVLIPEDDYLAMKEQIATLEDACLAAREERDDLQLTVDAYDFNSEDW